MRVLSRALVSASAVLGLVALVLAARDYWSFTVDDAFITLRYAKHLAEGLGPSWNPSAAPVEGYTTALWMGWLGLPHAIGIDALAFAKISGVVCTFAASGLAALLARELMRDADPRGRRVAMVAPFALLIAYWPLALHSVSGMETALATLLLTLFVLVAVRFARAPSPLRGRSLSVLALLAALTRPELALTCGITLVALVVLVPHADRRSLVRPAAVFLLLPGLAYFAARYAYFGLALPLSFYVKAQGQARLAGLDEVRAFFAPFWREAPHLGLLAVYGAIGRRSLIPALLGLAALAGFFVLPAHIMGIEGRYLMPLVPCLAALIGCGLGKLVARGLALLERRVGAVRWLDHALLAGSFALLAAVRLPAHEAESRERWLAYGRGISRAHAALARDLKQARLSVVRPTIALLDVGAVGYYSDWFVIDTYGLNDAHVALTRRRDVDYVMGHRPELLVLVSAEPSRYVQVFDWERPLHAAAVQHGYEPLCTYEFLEDYHLLVLARAGSRLRQTLACPRFSAATPSAKAL